MNEQPVGGSPNAEAFFEAYLATPLIFALFFGWKIYTKDWVLFIKASDMDLDTGLRSNIAEIAQDDGEVKPQKTWKSAPMSAVRALF